MSFTKAWLKLNDKLSPSKSVFSSPIRVCDHLLSKNEVSDQIDIKHHVWVLLNTEEFHYQNVNMLVYQSLKNVKLLSKLLKDKFNSINWGERLKDYELMAQGGFGQVYRAIDRKTSIEYALKKIIPPRQNNFYSFSKFSSNLLQERNIFLELNKSPFFVRILASFQSPDKTEFWFVLDFCLTDLRKIISEYPYKSDFEQISSDYIYGISWEKVSEIMTNLWSTNYEDLIFIYFFEMLCALHYLATRHIIHADIKPENFLIGKNCHLKLTDFGVSFRNDWFYRNSIIRLPQNEQEMVKNNEDDDVIETRGTIHYYDPEQHFQQLSLSYSQSIPTLLQRLNVFDYSISESNTQQSFLSDLYGVGLAFLELITGGLQIAEESLLPHLSEDFWNIEMIYNDDIREMVFVNPLSRLPCDRTKSSVFTFLISIFTPREIRAKDYIISKMIFRQRIKETVSYIDITKVENILYYKSKLMTKENVQNIVFHQHFINNLVEVSQRIKNKNYTDLKFGQSEKQAFNLHPFEFNSM